jgi:hypothetical protein
MVLAKTLHLDPFMIDKTKFLNYVFLPTSTISPEK